MEPNHKPAIKSFFDLDVWKGSHEFVLNIYRSTVDFLSEERFGLTQQLRRAAVSVPSNIVEGSGRRTTKDLMHFLVISRGSAEEYKYLTLLCRDLGFLEDKEFQELTAQLDRIGRMLNPNLSLEMTNLPTGLT